MIVKLRRLHSGSRVYLRVFVGRSEGQLDAAGSLTMTPSDAARFIGMLQAATEHDVTSSVVVTDE